MDISLLAKVAVNAPSTPSGTGAPPSPTAEAKPDDADRFAAILNQQETGGANSVATENRPAEAQTMGDRILGGLQGVADNIHDKWQQVGQVLDKQGADASAKDMLKVQAHMLEVSVEYDAVGKLVTRTSKNIEDLVKTQ